MFSEQNHTQLLQRKQLLDQAFAKLSDEFVGQDKVIQEIRNLISPWFLFPEAQERPLVVNLWGLTGTGKTSLVKSIAAGLGMQSRFAHFDMGEYAGGSGSWIKTMIREDIIHLDGKPGILCLDEFQFARTLNDSGGESNKDSLRVIWELLDSGRIEYISDNLSWIIASAERLLRKLAELAKNGFRLEKGAVKGNMDFFAETFEGITLGHQRLVSKPGADFFLSDMFTDFIDRLADEDGLTHRRIREKVNGFSLTALADWVEYLAHRPKAMFEVNLSRVLIFVTGNLDEAYPMSSLMDPEISADDLHRETLRIHIPQIKHALQRRFRNEQIARLGNNHVIYHSLPESAFREFIRRQMEKRAKRIREQYAISIIFDVSVENIIYSEGVYPAQGLRPLLTTLNQMIDGNLGHMLVETAEIKAPVKSVNWVCAAGNMQFAWFDEAGTLLRESKAPLMLKLEDVRSAMSKDVQAHTAVHESGHAVVAALVMRLLPSVVVSNAASGNIQGFCWVEWPDDLETRDTLRKNIMVSLGGYLAERMIFGEEFTSSGVVSDLERASAIANLAVKKFGMGKDPIRIGFPSPDQEGAFAQKESHAQEALSLLSLCRDEAQLILERNKLALLKMADLLIEKSRIVKEEIGAVLTKYAADEWVRSEGFIRKEDYFSFRNQIYAQIAKLQG